MSWNECVHELGECVKQNKQKVFETCCRVWSARKCKVQYFPHPQTWELGSVLKSHVHCSGNVGSNKFLHLPFAWLLLSN